MGLIENYFKFQKEYQEKYGERTVVIMQKEIFLWNLQILSLLEKNNAKSNDVDKISLFNTINDNINDNNDYYHLFWINIYFLLNFYFFFPIFYFIILYMDMILLK